MIKTIVFLIAETSTQFQMINVFMDLYLLKIVLDLLLF